ncbi:hypothetical protein HV356_07475 [Citrobacter sp. RHBSTW-01065]|nr:hypothetical protein [Citrobacter sp. RHBSTW-01065]
MSFDAIPEVFLTTSTRFQYIRLSTLSSMYSSVDVMLTANCCFFTTYSIVGGISSCLCHLRMPEPMWCDRKLTLRDSAGRTLSADAFITSLLTLSHQVNQPTVNT